MANSKHLRNSCIRNSDIRFLLVLRISLLFFLLPFFSFSQEYFQQEVNYQIHVSLDDEKHQLIASETIEYVNNSSQTLNFIYFHLWPNAYKGGKTALNKQMRQDDDLTLYFSKHEDRGWIDSLNFRVDGVKADFEFDLKNNDIGKLMLDKPLLTGERITITTPFRVQIPKGIFSRLGHLDQAYQITQWYPKPAVFDQDGWHQMPYLGQGEFYSEFGTFDVHITLPKNYVVGATGDLVDGQNEINWLNSKVVETEKIKEFDTYDLSFPPTSSEKKTLHYHQEKVHDFGWFADKRYHVLKGEVELPVSKRKVTTWAMFTNNEANLWKNAIEYLNDATYYYSLWVGEYAYNHVTAVDGVLSEGGGMEYPNVTVIGQSGNATSLEEVIMHEVGHNWFYGILASNERNYPWMDEGLNSFIELRYMKRKYPNLMLRDVFGRGNFFDFLMKWIGTYSLKHRNLGQHVYGLSARAGTDQPIELPSIDYSPINYGTIVYMKTAFVFNYLMAYLGEEKMDEIMHIYFQRWKFKHPQPDDIKKIITETTGDSLSWFFDGLINSASKMDYSIINIKNKNGKLLTKVKNNGSIAGPFPVSWLRGEDTISTNWHTGISKTKWIELDCSSCDKVVIDAKEVIPDINRKNNSMRVKGVFRKVEKLQPKLFAYYENPYRGNFAFSPIVGWNKYDGAMLGMAVYNNLMPKNKFDYTLMPMFAFGSKTVTGYAKLAYTLFHKKRSPSITFSVEGQRFDVGQVSRFYNPYVNNSPILPNNIVRTELKFHFSSLKRRTNTTHDIRFRNNIYFSENSGKVTQQIPQLTYKSNYAVAPHMAQLNVDLQWLDRNVKFGLEAIYRFKYKRSYGFRARLFLGIMLRETQFPVYNFRMSSSRGYQDYLYDATFLGRNETTGFLAQQMVESDGGFKSFFSVGSSNKLVTALNLSSTIYKKLPLEFFLSIGLIDNDFSPESEIYLIEFGASIILIRDVLEVHFPFLYTNNIKNDIRLNTPKYVQQIRFTFNINELKPKKRLHDIFN